MDNSGKTRISNSNKLYSILPKELRKEFSIGMHEFREGEFLGRSKELSGKWSEDTVCKVKESILSNGLKFSKYSRLLSTVSFENDDFPQYINGECSNLGGVIIALPKVLRSESGKEMFVGSPNENSKFNKHWSRREEATSLSDFILPEEGQLNSMFVIGTYEMTDNGIEFSANPNHIAFNKGRVPDEFFEETLGRLKEALRSNDYNPNEIEMMTKETLDQQKKYRGKINPSNSLEDEIGSLHPKDDVQNIEDTSISLTELGEKSYQHFGSKIAEKLKETIDGLKSKFFSKDKSKTTDIDATR